MHTQRYPTTVNNLLSMVPGAYSSEPKDYHLRVRKLIDQIATIARGHAGASIFEMDLDEILSRPQFSARFSLDSNVGAGERICYSLLNKNQVNHVGHIDDATGKDKYIDLDLALSEFVLAAMVAEFHREPCNCLSPSIPAAENNSPGYVAQNGELVMNLTGPRSAQFPMI